MNVTNSAEVVMSYAPYLLRVLLANTVPFGVISSLAATDHMGSNIDTFGRHFGICLWAKIRRHGFNMIFGGMVFDAFLGGLKGVLKSEHELKNQFWLNSKMCG